MTMATSWHLMCLLVIAASTSADPVDHWKDLVNWVREEGGFVHESLELRPSRGSNGIFTKGAIIEKDEILFSIPRACMITALPKNHDKHDYDEQEHFDNCAVTLELAKQLELGDQSKFAPYTNYLKATQPAGQLPSSWGPNGKKLCHSLLFQNQQLVTPPAVLGNAVSLDFKQDCSDHEYTETRDYAHQVIVQRGCWDAILIPLVDIMSHRNGNWTNTKSLRSTTIHDYSNEAAAAPVVLQASRKIEVNEEVYTTYYNIVACEDCDELRFEDYGTPELLRDYGFVEQFPQRWSFFGKFGFDLDQKDVGGELQGQWWIKNQQEVANEDDLDSLQRRLDRLEGLSDTIYTRNPEIPESEWRTIQQFYEALTTAIRYALQGFERGFQQQQQQQQQQPPCDNHPNNDESNNDESACTIFKQYDSFLPEPDDLPYYLYTCAFGRNTQFPGYHIFPRVESLYQDIKLYTNKQTKDSCFELDHILQICSSYRPHYHELLVHYPARYLDSIRRVVFVGGGDSMLLHEVLKYDLTLELVVGLELDQQVTRHSFKHFGTQPHWDNEKVQWWYGDAAKSLLMLPKDYFGSFDMVLVDLSETVMSMTVTDELDIFGSLALLLKEDGIIVKNELYLEEFTEIFDYTLQIHAYDIPVVCSQAVVLGSYGNDYLTKEPKDHGVEMIYDVMKETGRYDIWHDYRRNTTNTQAHCKREDEEEKKRMDQERSPGILMIVEAEDLTIELQPSSSVKEILVGALEKEDLTVVSALMSQPDDIILTPILAQPNSDDYVLVIVLEEGYMIARVWPEHHYCAFDLHVWSKFDAQESIKKALLSAVGNRGGNGSSSYRIVAGGMFGMPTWKEDEKNRGPRRTHECAHEDQESSRKLSAQPSVVATILKESVDLIEDINPVVAVLCGQESDSCESFDILAKNDKLTKVVHIYACSTIEGINEYMEDAQQLMEACQDEILAKMQDGLEGEKKYDAIILDKSTTFVLGQLIHKVFLNKQNKKQLLNEESVMVLAMIERDRDSWRRSFLDRFRRDILGVDPIFRAEVLLNSSDCSMEMGIVNIGDDLFVEKLVDTVSKIETATNLTADVRNIQGGMFTFQSDFVPSQFASPDEYDQSSPLEQWASQQPLGQQTVLQLELQQDSEDIVIIGTRVEVMYDDDQYYAGTIRSFNRDGSAVVKFDDGEENDGVDLEDLHKLKLEKLNLKPLSTTLVKDFVERAISGMVPDESLSGKVKVYAFNAVGEGCVLVSFWSGGSVVVLWDGRKHVDINLFIYKEIVEFSKGFGAEFERQYPLLRTILRDEQPRGPGRVVNFLRDLGEPRLSPHWA